MTVVLNWWGLSLFRSRGGLGVGLLIRLTIARFIPLARGVILISLGTGDLLVVGLYPTLGVYVGVFPFFDFSDFPRLLEIIVRYFPGMKNETKPTWETEMGRKDTHRCLACGATQADYSHCQYCDSETPLRPIVAKVRCLVCKPSKPCYRHKKGN